MDAHTCSTRRTWWSSLLSRRCWRCCRSTSWGMGCGIIWIRGRGLKRGCNESYSHCVRRFQISLFALRSPRRPARKPSAERNGLVCGPTPVSAPPLGGVAAPGANCASALAPCLAQNQRSAEAWQRAGALRDAGSDPSGTFAAGPAPGGIREQHPHCKCESPALESHPDHSGDCHALFSCQDLCSGRLLVPYGDSCDFVRWAVGTIEQHADAIADVSTGVVG